MQFTGCEKVVQRSRLFHCREDKTEEALCHARLVPSHVVAWREVNVKC